MSGGSNKSKSSTESKPLSPKERAALFDTGTSNVYREMQNPYIQSLMDYSAASIPDSIYDAGAYISAGGAYDPGAGRGVTDPGGPYSPGQAIDSGAYRGSQAVDPGRGFDPGAARQLFGGDYDRLEQNLLNSALAPLERTGQIQLADFDQQAADRGIFTSGLALQGRNDVYEALYPQISAAASDAIAQRYGLQSADQNAANQYDLTRASNLSAQDLARANELNQFALTNDQQLNQYELARSQGLNTYNLGASQQLNDYMLGRASDINQYNTGLNQYDLARSQGLNDYNSTQAAQQNQYNLSRADSLNAAQNDLTGMQQDVTWRPLEWLGGMWSDSNGVISTGSSKSGGWSI